MKTILLILAITLSYGGYSTDYSFSISGKQYKLVTTKKSWTAAAAWAVADGGYLVHIDSQAEQDSLKLAIIASGISTTYTTVNDGGGIAYVWIGAADITTEGSWLWDGDGDGVGINFYSGQGQNGSGNGTAINGLYNNWGGTSASGATSTNEPDDYLSNQDAAGIALDGWPAGAGFLGVAYEWNDIDVTNQLYFIVEYENTGIDKSSNTKKLPEIHINQTNSNTVNISASEPLVYLEIYSLDGKRIIYYNQKSYTIRGILLKERNIYFYRTVFESGLVKSGKFLIM